jgi:hypothetical protein
MMEAKLAAGIYLAIVLLTLAMAVCVGKAYVNDRSEEGEARPGFASWTFGGLLLILVLIGLYLAAWGPQGPWP